nr:hypothetical protein [Mesorhizobium sp. WSM3879]
MRGIAGDGDVENIAGKRVRPRADRYLSGRGIGIDLDADRRVDVVQQPFLYDSAAVERFLLFRGLNKILTVPLKRLLLALQKNAGRIADRCMSVVAAGVHDARTLRAVRHARGFP